MERRSRDSYHWRISLFAVMLLILSPLASAAIAGQQGAGTGTINGLVSDESQAVLPGVTVSASSPALQTPQVTTVTDERGEYRLPALPVGTYVITFELSGFQVIRREGIRLTDGFTARVDIGLSVGAVEETVTVSGAAPVVDVQSTTTVTHITREVLDSIPTGRNSFTGLIQLAPGARGALDVGGNAINVNPTFRAFGMVGEAWQAVDNVVSKNPRASDSGNYFDFSSWEEASVATIGHDASVPGRGVVINTVVKSGSNDFHGGVFYGGTNENFESRDEDEQASGVNVRDDFSFDIGGRIVRNKFWFWVGGRTHRTEERVVDCFKPDGEQCELTAQAKYLTPKLTWQVTQSQRVVGFAGLTDRLDIGALSALTAWSARRYQPGFNGVGKGEWQMVKGNSLVITAMAGGFFSFSGTKCIEENCTMIARRDRTTGFVEGLTNRAGERNREGRKQARFSANWYRANWIGGNHEIKTGFDYFHSPANRKILLRGEAQDYRLNYVSTTGRLVADRIEFFNNPVTPDNAIRQIYGYVADSVTIGRKLTLNLGLRYGYENAYENEGCRDASPVAGGQVFPAFCWDKLQMPIFHSLVPRLRASYDVTGDAKTVVKGGWGRFRSFRLFDHMQAALHNIGQTATYRWRDQDGNNDYTPGEINLSQTNNPEFLSLALAGQFASLGQGVVNPDETQPYTDEYSIQAERQIANAFAVRVTAVHSRALNQYRLSNQLRPYDSYNIAINSADPGEDGRVGTADDTGDVITWYNYPTSLQGVAFQQGMLINDERANEHYNSMEIALSKRLTQNWQFQASYTTTKRNIPLVANSDIFNTDDPNAEIFAENHTWEWTGRVSGSYMFPHQITASGNFEHRSGDPWARTALLTGGTTIPDLLARVEPIGSRRLPNINLLILRAEKRFVLKGSHEIQLRTNLYNVTNTRVETGINAQSGTTFGVVTETVLPRIIDFQVQYKF